MKRLISILLTVLLLATMIPIAVAVPVSAEGVEPWVTGAVFDATNWEGNT